MLQRIQYTPNTSTLLSHLPHAAEDPVHPKHLHSLISACNMLQRIQYTPNTSTLLSHLPHAAEDPVHPKHLHSPISPATCCRGSSTPQIPSLSYLTCYMLQRIQYTPNTSTLLSHLQHAAEDPVHPKYLHSPISPATCCRGSSTPQTPPRSYLTCHMLQRIQYTPNTSTLLSHLLHAAEDPVHPKHLHSLISPATCCRGSSTPQTPPLSYLTCNMLQRIQYTPNTSTLLSHLLHAAEDPVHPKHLHSLISPATCCRGSSTPQTSPLSYLTCHMLQRIQYTPNISTLLSHLQHAAEDPVHPKHLHSLISPATCCRGSSTPQTPPLSYLTCHMLHRIQYTPNTSTLLSHLPHAAEDPVHPKHLHSLISPATCLQRIQYTPNTSTLLSHLHMLQRIQYTPNTSTLLSHLLHAAEDPVHPKHLHSPISPATCCRGSSTPQTPPLSYLTCYMLQRIQYTPNTSTLFSHLPHAAEDPVHPKHFHSLISPATCCRGSSAPQTPPLSYLTCHMLQRIQYTPNTSTLLSHLPHAAEDPVHPKHLHSPISPATCCRGSSTTSGGAPTVWLLPRRRCAAVAFSTRCINAILLS